MQCQPASLSPFIRLSVSPFDNRNSEQAPCHVWPTYFFLWLAATVRWRLMSPLIFMWRMMHDVQVPAKSIMYKFDASSTRRSLFNLSASICTAHCPYFSPYPHSFSVCLHVGSLWIVSDSMPWWRISTCHNLLLVVHASFPNCHNWSHSFFRCKFSVMPRWLLSSCEVAPLWPIK